MKGMIRGIIVASLVMVMSMTGQALAGRGGHDRGNGKAEQGEMGRLHDNPVNILEEGEPVTVVGIVSEIGARGKGMTVDTGAETVAVHGVGPAPYWEELGADFPAVGDEITAEAYNVTCMDGEVRTIAASVAMNGGAAVEMIDPETGAPLWKRDFRGNDGYFMRNINILEDGEPVTVYGTVSEAGERGKGMTVDTDTGAVTVHGIGPAPHWEGHGVECPTVGDEITVEAYDVILEDGSVRTVAASVTMNGEIVELIDSETGKPLWKGGQGRLPFGDTDA
ncbi:hypothetical protein QUF80_01780 [Desulfococcaceae bacterium HSG8]|nr:hypothetical protein [Desulfococcaceae bacterium HSG8]